MPELGGVCPIDARATHCPSRGRFAGDGGLWMGGLADLGAVSGPFGAGWLRWQAAWHWMVTGLRWWRHGAWWLAALQGRPSPIALHGWPLWWLVVGGLMLVDHGLPLPGSDGFRALLEGIGGTPWQTRKWWPWPVVALGVLVVGGAALGGDDPATSG